MVDVATVQLCLQVVAANASLALGLAIAIGAACGLTVNFLLSRRYVFRTDGRRIHQQFVTFLGVSISTAVLRIIVAYTLVALLSLPVFAFLLTLPVSLPVERLAHLGAVGMVTVYSFLAHRHISFAGGFRKRLRARTTMVS